MPTNFLNEIAYAKMRNKIIRWLDPDNIPDFIEEWQRLPNTPK